tara:strand:+ start:1199 stop:1804 length:606 start_codon:yes stop_codon:yes gene_type:complete
MEKDAYKTILEASPDSLYREKGSKFIGYAFPVTDEDQVKQHITQLKKEHYNARHWCYAWQLGTSYENYRVNDDGEPSNSAGMPILGQLQSFHLTNTLIVVVRYFGGTKLGVGGLMQAYKAAARMSIESSKIVEKTIDAYFILTFDYPEMNVVMRIIKEEKINLLHQIMELRCEFKLAVRKKEAERIFNLFQNTYKVSIKQA